MSVHGGSNGFDSEGKLSYPQFMTAIEPIIPGPLGAPLYTKGRVVKIKAVPV